MCDCNDCYVRKQILAERKRRNCDSLTDIHKVLLESHPFVQEIQVRVRPTQSDSASVKCAKLLESVLQFKIQQDWKKQIEFLAFVGKVASFMDILADQIKDKVRQVREDD